MKLVGLLVVVRAYEVIVPDLTIDVPPPVEQSVGRLEVTIADVQKTFQYDANNIKSQASRFCAEHEADASCEERLGRAALTRTRMDRWLETKRRRQLRQTYEFFEHVLPDGSSALRHFTELLLDRKFENVLEIGSFEGGSTMWLTENLNASLLCVDAWSATPEYDTNFAIHQNMQATIKQGDALERWRRNVGSFRNRDKVTAFRGKSNDILPTLVGHRSFDLIYVDGAHTPSNALFDAVLAFRLLDSEGILIFDDFADGPFSVREPITAFLTSYQNAVTILRQGSHLILQKNS